MKVYSIGRNEDCTIVLDHPEVSRRHALLKVKDTGKMQIISMGANGTFVNGNKLKPNVPYSVKRSDVVSFAHAKQLDWNLVHNPVWWVKYVLYGFLGIILIASAYALIDHWLIKRPSAQQTELLKDNGKGQADKKSSKEEIKNPEKLKDKPSKGHDKIDDKKNQDNDIPSDSRFFPQRKKISNKGSNDDGNKIKNEEKPSKKPSTDKKPADKGSDNHVPEVL